MIDFTVIIPIYNLEQWIRSCINSISEAARTANCVVECIIVDDGSTDGSGTLIDELARSYLSNRFFIRVIHHERNLGVSSARNSALDVARGEWICFVDGDDLMTPDSFQILGKCIQKCPNAHVIQFGIRYVDEHADIEHAQLNVGTPIVTITDDRAEILSGCSGKSFVTYAYRRSKMGDIRFQPLVLGEDRLFLAFCLSCAGVKVETNEVGYICMRRSGSAQRSPMTIRKIHDSFAYRIAIMDLISKSGVPLLLSVRRRLLSGAIEGTAGEVMRLPSDQRKDGWREWFLMLEKIPIHAITSTWFRMVIIFLNRFQFPFFAWLLCIIPLILKKKGLRRNR